jgi:hypothetical protein
MEGENKYNQRGMIEKIVDGMYNHPATNMIIISKKN